MKKNLLIVLALLFCFRYSVQPVFAEVTPPEVHQKGQQIKDVLTLLSKEMGISFTYSRTIDVDDVSPREVYFQAATLHSKTAKLMFEFISEEGQPIDEYKIDAVPADVLLLLNESKQYLAKVASTLNLNIDGIRLQKIDLKAGPKEVFQLIVHLNRLTNQLLDFKFSPAEAHQKITESIAIASAILQTYPLASAVFYPEQRSSGKTPTEVYQRLAAMYRDLTVLFEKFDKSCLLLGDSETRRQNVQPSDVYDLAVLFASQLRYWHSLLPNKSKIRQSYYPGKVVPSDVYKRLSILSKQIDELMRLNNVTKIAG